MKKKIYLSRKNLDIVNNIILIDGFSGTGKSLLGSILSHLPGAEQWQTDYFYEQIAILDYLHQIPLQSAKALCEVKSNETIYNLFIGRNVNFRLNISPLRNELKDKYLTRLKKPDKVTAIREIIKTNPILILHIHYIFGYSKFLIDVFWDNLKLYLIVLRNPFYLIDYWYSTYNSPKRDKKNPDFFQYISIKKKLIPWYTREYSNAYLKANDFEKSIMVITELYKRIIKMFNKLNAQEKKRVKVIFFEEFLDSPQNDVDLIKKKLNVKTDKKFNDFYKKTIKEAKN